MSCIMKLKCKVRNISLSNVLFSTMTSARQLNVWTVYFQIECSGNQRITTSAHDSAIISVILRAFKLRHHILIFPSVCLCALTLYPMTARLRCCDRYIRCHRLLAVKLLSPREHAGRRVGKGGTLGSVEPSDCRCQR